MHEPLSSLLCQHHTLEMAGTRSSTRQSASTKPKYTENNSSSSEDVATKPKKAQPTRRKRARPEEEKHDDDEEYATTHITRLALS
jgi:hypothetical protein